MVAQNHSLLILDDYQRASETMADWGDLADLPRTVLTEAIAAEDVVERLKPFTMVHAMRERTKLPREVLEQLPNLQFITTTGGRNRGIDLEACKDLGIVVSGTESHGNQSPGTVEQTWALILALSRRLVVEHQGVQAGSWQLGMGTCLYGKTIGLIGVGRLGKAVANVASAFGMKVQAWSPHLDEKRAAEAGVKLAASLEDLLSTSDVVSVHLVLSPSTIGILGTRELALLKPEAILVNTSRGPLIDEPALIEYTKQKTAGGVGLDVFDKEPLPKDHPLRTIDHVVLSPHFGYVDDSTFPTWWPQTVENIQAFLAGNPVRLMQA